MTIDLASLLNVSGNNLYNTASKTESTTGTDFTSVLMNALSSKRNDTDENPLYTALTSATQTDFYTQSTSSSYLDYLSNSNGSASSLEGYLSNYTNTQTTSQQYSDSLMASFQGKMLHTLSAAKVKLTENAAAYEAKMGENPSEAAKLRVAQMQNNVALLSNFISEKQTAPNLVNQINKNSNLTQYLVNKNQHSLF